MKSELLALFLVCVFVGTNGYPCSSCDPYFDSCIDVFVYDFFTNNSLDPMYRSTFTYTQSNGTVTVNGTLTNVTVTGFNNSIVSYVYDPETNSATVTQTIPTLTILSHQEMDAKLGVFPYSSNGKVNMTLENLTINYAVDFVKENDVYQIENITAISSTIDGGSIQIQSDNPMNQPIDDFLVAFFNADPQLNYKNFNEIPNKMVPEMVKDNVNPPLAQIPASSIITH